MIKYSKIILLFITGAFIFASCAPQPMIKTKKEFSPKIYDEKPVTIAILPPINQTTAADAKELLMATMNEVVSNKGYYPMPIELMNTILKAQGAWETSSIPTGAYKVFNESFGADALLKTTILEWDTDYNVLSGAVIVAIEFQLISCKSGDIVWEYKTRKEVNTTKTNTGNFLTNLVATAIKTASTDYFKIARSVDYMAIGTMPLGKYCERFDKDQDDKVVVPKEQEARFLEVEDDGTDE